MPKRDAHHNDRFERLGLLKFPDLSRALAFLKGSQSMTKDGLVTK